MVIFQNGFSPKAASRQSRVFGDPRLLTIVPKLTIKSNSKWDKQSQDPKWEKYEVQKPNGNIN